MFGRAVFEAIEVKGRLRLNFEAKFFLNSSESLVANLEKVRQTDICMTNGSKVLIYLTSTYFWNRLSYEYV